jgi:hypothetical protein
LASDASGTTRRHRTDRNLFSCGRAVDERQSQLDGKRCNTEGSSVKDAVRDEACGASSHQIAIHPGVSDGYNCRRRQGRTRDTVRKRPAQSHYRADRTPGGGKEDDFRDVYAEAKGNGFDVKALRTIVRLRKQDANERAEQETILETYMQALGML